MSAERGQRTQQVSVINEYMIMCVCVCVSSEVLASLKSMIPSCKPLLRFFTVFENVCKLSL